MRLVSTVAIGLLVAGCGSKSPAGGDDDGGTDGGASGSSDGGGNGQTPTNVLVTMTHRPTNAAMFSFLVAYQDGAGAWTLAPAPTGDLYTLPIYSSVYAVAWTCIGIAGQLRTVSELQFTVSERPALVVDIPARCTDALPTVTLKGTITNTSMLTNYSVRFGDRSATVNDGQFMMQTPPGTHDLVVLSAGSIAVGGDAVASGAIVQRNLVVNAATSVTLDGNDDEDTQSFSVDNLPGGFAVKDSATTLLYANGTVAPISTDSSSAYETESLADDQMVATDVYDQQMSVTSGTTVTTASVATAHPGDIAWADVPAIGTVTGVVLTTPYPRITTTWTTYPNALGYTFGATQTSTAGTVVWTAQFSSTIGDAGMYTMQDLTQLAGWNPALQMVAGAKISGRVQAMTSTGTGDFPALVPPVVGTHRTFATGQFAVTP